MKRPELALRAGAQDSMKRPVYLTLDLETTGLTAGLDGIVELATIVSDADQAYASLTQIVQPANNRLPHEKSGISIEMLVGKPSFAAIAPAVIWLLAWADEWIVYNAQFDLAFLAAELAAAGFDMPDRRVYDPYVVLRTRTKTRFKLQDACRHVGLALPADYAWHTAFGDAAATLRLAMALKQQDNSPQAPPPTQPFGIGMRFN